MSDEARSGNAVASPPSGTNPWLIALIVSVAAFMEVLDTTIANVALKYIAGGLAVGPSQAAWVVTSYLVANSIVLCASGWLSATFGRRNFFMTSIALFSVSSVLCGFSWNLQSLLFFRVLQGLAGGGLTPVALSILADTFAPAKRGQALAVFGVAVVVAPVVGPVLGGWLSDNLSWHWCFLINGPVGIASFVSVYFFIKEKQQEKLKRAKLWKAGLRFDLIGFILITTFLGALEIVLDKGQEEDWFGSSLIIVFASLSAVALVVFVPWALVKEEPILDIRMLASRQFSACFIVMLGVGAVLIATTQILPQLLQDNYGYTSTLAGLALTPGGVVTMIMMFVVGSLSFIQPKYLIAIGAAFVAYGMYFSTSLYSDSDFSFFAWSRIITSIGLPLLFIPITAASYNGLRPDQTDQASSLINLARNFGGSIGVSIAQTVLVRREQFHQSRLIEQVGTWNPNYQQALQSAQSYFATQPSSGSPLQVAGAWIGQVLQQQASLMSYIDVFVVLSIISGLLIPLALTLKSSKAGENPGAAH